MKITVIDTNVLLVANGNHADVSDECRIACINKLLVCRTSGIIVIDAGFLILQEYLKRTFPNQPKGVGDEFLKWLLQNKSNRQRVHIVHINEFEKDFFVEFSDKDLQSEFDTSDRKFVAVAIAHHKKPPILQATDSKWLNWSRRLKKLGVVVEFVCLADAKRFYAEKFPQQDIQELFND